MTHPLTDSDCRQIQHNRIVNEVVNDWRQFSSQIRRYTISRVPADVVVGGYIR